VCADPYSAWKDCPQESKSLTAIETPWPQSFGTPKRVHGKTAPKQIDHFATALDLYRQLSKRGSALEKAVQACDFAAFSEVKHPFRVTDEPANGAALTRKYICTNTKFPTNNLKTVLCAL
jgi:hypothetical protein